MTDSNKKPNGSNKKPNRSNKKPKVGSKWRLKKKLAVKIKKKPKDPGSGYTIRRVPKTRKKPTSFWV